MRHPRSRVRWNAEQRCARFSRSILRCPPPERWSDCCASGRLRFRTRRFCATTEPSQSSLEHDTWNVCMEHFAAYRGERASVLAFERHPRPVAGRSRSLGWASAPIAQKSERTASRLPSFFMKSFEPIAIDARFAPRGFPFIPYSAEVLSYPRRTDVSIQKCFRGLELLADGRYRKILQKSNKPLALVFL